MSTFTKNVVWLVASLALLVLIGYSVLEYIDSRFGSGVGIIVSAIMLGTFVTMAIVFLTMTAVNRTHEAAGEDLSHGIQYIVRPMAEAARLQREYARAEVAGLAGRAKIEVMEAKQVDRLANQRAGLLIDLERQKWQQAQQAQGAPAWNAVDDDDDNSDVQYYQ